MYRICVEPPSGLSLDWDVVNMTCIPVVFRSMATMFPGSSVLPVLLILVPPEQGGIDSEHVQHGAHVPVLFRFRLVRAVVHFPGFLVFWSDGRFRVILIERIGNGQPGILLGRFRDDRKKLLRDLSSRGEPLLMELRESLFVRLVVHDLQGLA